MYLFQLDLQLQSLVDLQSKLTSLKFHLALRMINGKDLGRGYLHIYSF